MVAVVDQGPKRNKPSNIMTKLENNNQTSLKDLEIINQKRANEKDP